jgi:hypothetical protein
VQRRVVERVDHEEDVFKDQRSLLLGAAKIRRQPLGLFGEPTSPS